MHHAKNYFKFKAYSNRKGLTNNTYWRINNTQFFYTLILLQDKSHYIYNRPQLNLFKHVIPGMQRVN